MRTLVGIAIGVAFVAALVFVTLDQMRASCEVCVVYRGHQACQEATAVDRGAALRQAVTTACARISSGVTDSIECGNTPPVSVRCSE